jgi:hypothetical protein
MKFWRKYHRWIGLFVGIVLFLFAFSGVILNHRNWLSSSDISRKFLPETYQYNNWNNASLKGQVTIGNDSVLLYGNIGCWLWQPSKNVFTNFNNGFQDGIDNRKIAKLIKVNDTYFAGTLFGLYQFSSYTWKKVDLDLTHPRITDIIEKDDSLLILTRSELLQIPLKDLSQIKKTYLPAPINYDNKVSLFKTFWVIHSGEILGMTGKIVVDCMAILFLFLAITGFIYYFSPGLIKRTRKKQKSTEIKKKVYRFSVKWHNKAGVYASLLLLIVAFTGMFLRPPFLITIANSKVAKIPFTHLDSLNPWYDQLRAIRYNEQLGIYLISTSEGFYAWMPDRNEMIPVPNQPPVSVMGINVFEPLNESSYLIGSFNGLFRWNPFTGETSHFLSGQPYNPAHAPAMPISDHMVSGYIQLKENSYYIDYNHGIIHLNHQQTFPVMPEVVLDNSPMSLWNLALELHTGRFFQRWLGPFYILIVPLTGLLTIGLILTGFWIWWKFYRKKRRQ